MIVIRRIRRERGSGVETLGQTQRTPSRWGVAQDSHSLADRCGRGVGGCLHAVSKAQRSVISREFHFLVIWNRKAFRTSPLESKGIPYRPAAPALCDI